MLDRPGRYLRNCRLHPYRFQCRRCDKVFTSKRCTAMYCGAACRKYASRARAATKNPGGAEHSAAGS